jgi:hypothetical protein
LRFNTLYIALSTRIHTIVSDNLLLIYFCFKNTTSVGKETKMEVAQ